MEAEKLAALLGIKEPRAVTKAKEFERLLTMRAPTGLGPQNGGTLCKGAAALCLACREFGVAVDKAQTSRLGCFGQSQLLGAITTAQRLLGVGDSAAAATPKEVCKRLGNVLITAEVESTVEMFKERFLAKLPPKQRAFADLSSPVFVAAAFYVVSLKRRSHVTQMQIASSLDLSKTELQRAVTAMQEIFGDDEKKEKKPRQQEQGSEKKRQRAADEGAAAPTEQQQPEDVSMASQPSDDADMSDDAYFAWRQRFEEEAKQLSAKPSKKMKQTTLI